ncbi:MAG: AMIN domain-containing protein [Candidatus Sericytochromatia bacterium]|nr:AMIN domain-containing protein [Candidatus Sericytochromatia bacterium]
MKTLRNLLVALSVMAIAAPVAEASNMLPGVGPVLVAPDQAFTTLTLPGRAGSPYRVAWASQPYRLVVDVQGFWLAAPESSLYIGQGLVTQIRASRLHSGISRLIFELRGPADMRAENRGPDLTLVVMPRGRGLAPAAPPLSYAPSPAYVPPPVEYQAPPAMYQAPLAVPTPRPLPPYPGYALPYAAYPAGPPVTPAPVMPPMGWPVTPPQMAPAPPQAPPMAPPAQVWTAPSPIPAPPAAMPQAPRMSPPPAPVAPVGPEEDLYAGLGPSPTPHPMLGNHVWLGGGLLLAVDETYTKGRSSSFANGVPALEFAADPLFHPNVGLSVAARMQGYSIKDQSLTAVSRTYTRDEQEVALGVRGRFDLMPGFEVFAQPQAMVRNVGVATQLKVGNDDVTNPLEGEFLSASHTGFGGGLGLGAGYRVVDWFSLVAGGEFNFLAGGSGPTAPIYPLMNYRVGLDTRFYFGPIAAALGYKFSGYSGDNGSYSYSWHGPALNLGFAY